MKKIILAVMILTTGYALCAQETVVYKGQTASTFSTYSIPEPIYVSFKTNYPTADVATWQTLNGWWRATYKDDNNRIIHVYYNQQPWYLEAGRDVNYKVALPVINTYVPETVITAAINSYGANLYSITAIKAAENSEVYQIGLLEDGILKTIWMDPQSTVYTDIDKMKAKANDNMKLKMKMDE